MYKRCTNPEIMAKCIRLALDWTPNTIHTGFYVAQQKGLYEDAGLEVEFITPGKDNDALSPAQSVEQGLADIAIVSSETVISFHTKENPFPLVAIASILAKDVSAIVTLQSSGLEYPAQLDGKIYASHKARFEDQIVRQLIKNNGGKGDLQLMYTERLNTWNTLLAEKADATWILLPWEGMEARLKGIVLNVFQLEDYDIPYGYNPVIAVHKDMVKKKKLRKFIKATAKGYKFAKNNPLEAAKILIESANHPSLNDIVLIEQSQVFIAQYYFDENGKWGVMKNKVWKNFIEWLINKDMLVDTKPSLNAYDLFSNDLFED